jgi:hypothetical protein
MSPIKAVFEIFKCQKHGETLEFFFFRALSLPIVDSIAIALLKYIILGPIPVPITADTLDYRWPSPFPWVITLD